MSADLTGLMKSFIDQLESQLFTSLPATIIRFNPNTQTATVKPVGLEHYSDGISKDYTEIDNIPVVFPSSNGGSLTFPIKPKDEVLLIFTSRNYDNWFATGNTKKGSTSQRYHDYNDAIALIGMRSKGNSLNANQDSVVLSYLDNSLLLNEDGSVELNVKDTLKISNSSYELIDLLSQLVDAVSSITTHTIYGPNPVLNKATFIDLKNKIDTFKE